MVSLLSTTGMRRVIVLLHSISLLAPAWAEPFYQRRDHLDQSRYIKVYKDNVVKDKQDAEFVLSKYGYLRCQIRKRKREVSRSYRNLDAQSDASPDDVAPWPVDFNLSEEGGLEVCDEAKIQEAIQEYQRTYNLPATGMLDEETKVMMSTSRCGNKDTEKAVLDLRNDNSTSGSTTTTPPLSLFSILSTSTSAVPAFSDSDGNVRIRSSAGGDSKVGVNPFQHKSPEDSNKSSFTSNQRLWKRAVNRIRRDDPSALLRLLKGATTHKETSSSRHRRHLEEYIRKLNRDDPQILKPWSEEEHERAKRSILVKATKPVENIFPHVIEGGSSRHSNPSEMFNNEVVRWRLLTTGYSTRIPAQDQRATLDLAFRMWSEVIPLRFIEDTTSDINTVDIEVAFGRGSHQNCEHDFDGNGGEIAHSQQAGNMHFDDEENFKSIRSYTPDGIYLLRVAVHEIGHVLGLAHTNKSQSIMYAIYRGTEMTPEFELSRDDRKEIQKIYGVCKGKFSTVFDWVRKRPDNQFIYNTYFFRENHYWMYENHANRTRYGDPLYIAREWRGVPNSPDGYLHKWYFTGTDIIDEAYFFTGEYYFKYDSETDQVYEGWPRRITEDFGPKPGQTEGVPDNLDSVFFDMRDKNIYFFKDDMVYVYDPKEPLETRGCCVRKRKIWEEYPPAEGHAPLPGKLDAVYYSYQDKMQYFIKDESLWRNKFFDPRQKRLINSVELTGNWYDRWMDICDVQAE